MSGHSKWSTIKRKKGAADAARGRIFTRLIKEITIAARMGGGDVEANPRLRLAVSNAKAQNMPKDNIERAIKKGTGELEGVSYEEMAYEGYGPGGVAIIIECLTDNKNRTVSDVRYVFNKHNGSLGGSNSVAFLFSRKGLIVIPKDEDKEISEEALMEAALEAGAEDIREEDEGFEVTTDLADLGQVQEALEAAGFGIESAEPVWVPATLNPLDDKTAVSLAKMLEAFENVDDVQNVWHNGEFPEGFEED